MATDFTRVALLCGLTLGVMESASAQDDWNRVTSLSAGTQVNVTTMDRSVHKSLLDAATPNAIQLSSGEIAKTDVQRVVDLSNNHRLRNALIGAAIGVAGGLALDKSAGTRFSNEGRDVSAGLYAGSIGLGAVIGALIPSHPTIYRSR